MFTERSDPETKTLFMFLANIAQSELANQNRRIWRGVPNVNNNMAAAIARKKHEVSLSSKRFFCLDFVGIKF